MHKEKMIIEIKERIKDRGVRDESRRRGGGGDGGKILYAVVSGQWQETGSVSVPVPAWVIVRVAHVGKPCALGDDFGGDSGRAR
jgi:hypothetical protein